VSDSLEQDKEDYDQEQKIKEWLENRQGTDGEFDYKYINSKGNVRNTIVKGQRLDKEFPEDSTATLHDIVAGCDGRDLEYRDNVNLYNEIDKYLACLGFDEEMSEWIIKKMLRFSELQSNLPFERYLTSLE
jgi:hypothetical protein